MRESRFVNPHGLPDERQQTSARDMAILGRALYREFPEHRDLFQIGAIQLGRRVMANHNGLMGRYPGRDGMKTGFICSSGFNVVASATRGGRRLITVVLGSPSATERTLRAADLFDRGFGSFGWGGQSLEDLPPAASMTRRTCAPISAAGAARSRPRRKPRRRRSAGSRPARAIRGTRWRACSPRLPPWPSRPRPAPSAGAQAHARAARLPPADPGLDRPRAPDRRSPRPPSRR
jgi:hypothetical protein